MMFLWMLVGSRLNSIFLLSNISIRTLCILGRPWGRMTRAQMANKDDGSYVVKIKSTDGRRIVEFIAVPAQHERIREHVRPADEIGDDDLGISALKGEGVRH